MAVLLRKPKSVEVLEGHTYPATTHEIATAAVKHMCGKGRGSSLEDLAEDLVRGMDMSPQTASDLFSDNFPCKPGAEPDTAKFLSLAKTAERASSKSWGYLSGSIKTGAWRSLLTLTDRGAVRATKANLELLLLNLPEWAGAFALNELTATVDLTRDTPVTKGKRPINSTDMDHILGWMQLHEGPMDVHKENVVRDAISNCARERTFSPVREYLKSLKSDGRNLIDGWLIKYAGAEDTKYTRAVGTRWLISAVMRAMEPGCKADSALVLEGPQNAGKSSLLKALCKDISWFSDTDLVIGTKDSKEGLVGKWIIELSEMASTTKADVRATKSFLSSSCDYYRASYDRSAQDHPRMCVFAGTHNANGEGFLNDPTGARRFWPVTVSGKIDHEGVARDRDQLFAEAMELYRSGEKNYLFEEDLQEHQKELASAATISDPWEDAILQWVDKVEGEVTVARLMKECLGIDLKDQHRGNMGRVGHILVKSGRSKQRVRTKDGQIVVWRLAE